MARALGAHFYHGQTMAHALQSFNETETERELVSILRHQFLAQRFAFSDFSMIEICLG
jgi:hypothetical protein